MARQWTASQGFTLGVVAGALVAVGVAHGLRLASAGSSEPLATGSATATRPEATLADIEWPDRSAELAPDFSDEFDSPWADVPSNRRVYTLSLNNPDTVPAAEATHMRPDDLVIGVVLDGLARAYPWWVASNFHVHNDMLGPTPIYMGICEVCTGASAFVPYVPEYPGLRLSFEHSGVHNGTFEVSDLETLSQWHPFTGIARSGPLAGAKLRKLPTFLETWERWAELHPHTDVVLASKYMRERGHGAREGQLPGDPYMPSVFGDTADFSDERLAAHELVYGLISQSGGDHLAVPLEAVPEDGQILSLTVGDTPFVLFRKGELRIHAFEAMNGRQALQLEVASAEPLLLRDQGGTVWNQWGRAVEGPATGASLTAARGYVTEWYEWSTANPDSPLYSASEASQGG